MPTIERRLAELERKRAGSAPARPKGKPPTLLQFVDALSIEDKESGALIRFHLWPAQRKALSLMAKEPRLFVLKARQLGLTWLVLAVLLYWGTFWGNRVFLVARQSGEDAADAIHRLKTMLASMPAEWRPRVVVDNVMSIEFTNGSRYQALTATQRIGRGRAAYAAIADELCFWEWQAEQLAALEAGCARLFIVTTGNGPNDHAHRLWTQAQLGKGRFKTLFLPWSAHPGRDAAWYVANVEESAEPRLARREFAATANDAFASPAGVFFERFDSERNVKDVEVVSGWRTVRGIDWGYHNPACVWLQVSPQGQLFVVHELIPTNLTTAEFIGEVLRVDASLGLAVPVDTSFVDPAGNAVNVAVVTSEVEQARRAGLNPQFRSSLIRDGCVRMADEIAAPELPLVVSKACPWLIEALSTVKPDRVHDDTYDEGSPFTHILDALRMVLVNLGVRYDMSDWKAPEPSFGISTGIWNKVW